jgi:cytochrome c1
MTFNRPTSITQWLSIAAIAGVVVSGTHALAAGGEAIHIDRQQWSFGGFLGRYDNSQLQRGFLVYKEVCASCHGMKRLSFRNLSQPGGPEFTEAQVKSLAATYKIADGPNEKGKMFQRPGVLADRLPSPYANEQEARNTHNGAYPPDLSVIAKARGIESDRPFYAVPFGVLTDIVTGYQEAGADYVYALLTGYADPPKDLKLADGMNYNKYFPGNQIAMVAPLSDGVVSYKPKQADPKMQYAPETVPQYAKDVAAFLAWAADPTLEERKRIGLMAMIYLLITTVLLYFAKKRLWSNIPH